MNEASPPYDEDELSPEDLAVLQAFDTMEVWNTDQATSSGTTASAIWSGPPAAAEESEDDATDDDMLLTFVTEAEEDLAKMRRALNQLEQDEHIDPARFRTLQRAAHKIRGTAGAIEYNTMATIAGYIEVIAEQITKGLIFPLIGMNALTPAVSALEASLEQIITDEKDSDSPLEELELLFKSLNIDLEESTVSNKHHTSTAASGHEQLEDETLLSRSNSRLLPSSDNAYVDVHRFERLVQDSEQLAKMEAPLVSAQAQVETALQELAAAQAHLQQLQPSFPSFLMTPPSSHATERRSSSSLVTRIIDHAWPHNDTSHTRKARSRSRTGRDGSPPQWDELNLEHYSEKDVLLRALNEAVANVTICTSRVNVAFERLRMAQQEYIAQAAAVRSDTLLLRLVPLSTLVPRLQRVVTMSTAGYPVQFEITGESTEIDQDILESLANPLLRLLRTCITDAFSDQANSEKQESYLIWLRAHGAGNEITIEVGFSMSVHGGALDAIREPLQLLNGTIALQRNTAGGMSFYLRFPRSRGAVRCLLVGIGDQRLIVPFSQVQRIGERKKEQLDVVYTLQELLGFHAEPSPEIRIQPVLILPQGASRMVVGIAVDEVIGEVELVVKPLPPYLQRPGIAGSTVDGKGRVLLLLDTPSLIRHYIVLRRSSTLKDIQPTVLTRQNTLVQPKVLVADDSTYLRQSLLQTLRYAHYDVAEARDGMEALEQLLDYMPDIFVLDIEMPNLNGYDLLDIMSLYPELAKVKVIMLTSRSSEKHMQRARELGAHAYLTKPCSQETLLTTIQQLLTHEAV